MSYEEFQRGVLFFEAKDYAGAARILEPLVEQETGNRSALELLARAYFHSAQLGRAEAAFHRLLDLDPCNGWAYEALARTLERRSRPDEAARYRKIGHALGAEPSDEIEVSVSAADLA